MISLGKFLTHKRESAIGAVKTLLLGIARTAVQTGEWDREDFQRRLESAAKNLNPESSEDTLEAEITAVVEALARYNSAVEERAAAQQKELRTIIAASLDTVAGIGSSSEAGIAQLRSLETKLESASTVDDLRLLRGKLFGCLTLVRNESVRMQMDSQRLIRSLHASVLHATAELQPGTDATTGLPGPSAIEKLLQAGGEGRQERHVALFVITDMMSINTRYGRVAGDDVLRLATEYLTQGFGEGGQVHRWHGPVFLVVPAGALITLDQVKEKARSLSRTPFTVSLSANGEMKTLPIFLSWMVQTLPTGELTEEARRTLEAFASKHSGSEAT
jgi:GGDEF domain-containing protein